MISDAEKDQRMRELVLEILDDAKSSEVASNRYQAHLVLYNEAVKMNDAGEIAAQRDTLHTLLDVILDCTLALHSHKAAIDALQQT